jgi:CBS domain-containing protein
MLLAVRLMRKKGVRRLPMVEDGKVVGVSGRLPTEPRQACRI